MDQDRVDYLTRINAVSRTCIGDDHLFARYGYKYMKDFSKVNPEIVFNDLQIMPTFQNEFQEIYMTGLLEHYFGKNFLPWMTDKKLDKKWFYGEEFGYTNEDFYETTFKELKDRNIYV